MAVFMLPLIPFVFIIWHIIIGREIGFIEATMEDYKLSYAICNLLICLVFLLGPKNTVYVEEVWDEDVPVELVE